MSLFKKLFASSDASQTAQAATAAAAGAAGMPSGIQSMKQDLQKKFAKGVQYNMKVIIKGDRNVGKTTMWRRLQGEKFFEEYMPTEQIQVASISWNYKVTDDVVKVEVWDVVDKGKRRKKTAAGLKLTESVTSKKPSGSAGANATQSNGQHANTVSSGQSADGASPDADSVGDEPVLDAEWVDVYKGTQAVFLLFDITKSWTFAYVEQELSRVPTHIPVLVLANHRDMGHHRTVTEEQARFAIESLDRPPGAALVRYAEMSLRNGFGLRYVYQFLNVPFLLLQRESLMRALETNAHDVHASIEELDAFDDSEVADYDRFADTLTQQRRTTQEQLGAEALKREREKQAAAAAAAASATSAASQQQQTAKTTQPANVASQKPTVPSANSPQPTATSRSANAPERTASTPAPAPAPAASNKSNTSDPVDSKSLSTSSTRQNRGAVVDIDNFVAEDAGSLNDFLNDDVKITQSSVTATKQLDSDDETSDRPVIQALAEDLDPQDALTLTKTPAALRQAPSESSDDEPPAPSPDRPTRALESGWNLRPASDTRVARAESINSAVNDESASSPTTQEPAFVPSLSFDANDLDALEALGNRSLGATAEAASVPARKPKAAATKKSKAKRSEVESVNVNSDADLTKPKASVKKTTKKTDATKRKSKTVRNTTDEYDEL